MDIKEKIKLLGDIQAGIDNTELKAMVEILPSGDFLWQKFSASLTSELNTLLTGTSAKEIAQVTELARVVNQLEKSAVVELLKRLEQKLGQEPAVAPVAPRTVPTAQPDFPPEDTTPLNQEDMHREWERQQTSGPQRRNRGGVLGHF